MELIDFLKSDVLIKKVRLKAREQMWGPEQAVKWCADDRAIVAEIERQIWELEEGI